MSKLDELDPDFRKLLTEQLIPAIERVTGLKWGIPQAKRSLQYQHELWLQGRTDIDGDGKIDGVKVTNADAGSSPHNFGFAADCCPFEPGTKDYWWKCPEKYWKMLAELAEGLGLTSGYFFKTIHDPPHIEDPEWRLAKQEWVRNGKPLI